VNLNCLSEISESGSFLRELKAVAPDGTSTSNASTTMGVRSAGRAVGCKSRSFAPIGVNHDGA
jgi:hypothetical protein